MDLRLTTILLTALYISTAAGMFGPVYYANLTIYNYVE